MAPDLPPDDHPPRESRQAGTRGRSRFTWLVTAAVAVGLGLAAGYVVLSEPQPVPPIGTADEPTVVPVTLPAGGAGQRCMAPTAEALGRADLAVDAEVADVRGSVTLVPTRVYTGGPADNVRVEQASPTEQQLLLGTRFEEGGRYLVAVQGGEVMVCGFSGPYDEDLVRLYEDAFRR